MISSSSHIHVNHLVEKILFTLNLITCINFGFSFLGSNNVCSIHEWKGQFQGENILFKMTSVCGHVMGLDFVGKKK